MASFDIISAAAFSYRLAWRERRYLMRLATVPLFIKFACFFAIAQLGWNDNFIRQALVMLPSFLADGWMLAHMVRLIYLDQRWPYRHSGSADADAAMLQARAEGVFGGMLVFALTQFIFTGLVQVAWQVNQVVAQDQSHVPFPMVAAAIAFFAGSIWAFRLLWLYIPASVSYSLWQCLRDIRGYSTSFPMIGLWLACFAPAFAVFSVMASIIVAPYLGSLALPLHVEVLMSFLRALTDTAVIVLSTGAMARGLHVMISSAGSRAA